MGLCGSKLNHVINHVGVSMLSRRSDRSELDETEQMKIPLEAVLKNVSYCKAFAKFISAQCKTANDSATRLLRTHQLNFLYFCLHVQDYRLIAPETLNFKRTYAQDILDTYLNDTAKKSISVSASDLRQITNTIAQLPNDLFDSIRQEGLDVLRPVFRQFDANAGSHGLYSTRMKQRKSFCHSFAAAEPDQASKAQAVMLQTILTDPKAGRVLKKFFEPRGQLNALSFLLEEIAFQETFHAYKQGNAVDIGYLLKQMHRIYRKYIKVGTGIELPSTIVAAVQKACQNEAVSPIIFHEAAKAVRMDILTNHFRDFLTSKYYQEYSQWISTIESRKKKHRDTRSKIETLGLDAVIKGAPTLQEILKSNAILYFRQYMSSDGGEAVLLFWQQVEEFKLMPHTQKDYLNARAKKIFNKFIRRGANLELDIPSNIRQQILQDFDCVTNRLFEAAQTEILCEMDMDWYIGFLESKYYGKMMSASDETAEEQEKRRQREAKLAGVEFKDILTVPEWLVLFRRFLSVEKCSHPLMFWEDVAHFEALPKSSYLVAQSKKIYAKYIAPKSDMRFKHLSQQILDDIETQLSYPSPGLFSAAKGQVATFMELELYPKFRTSEYFLQQLDLSVAIEKAPARKSSVRASAVDLESITTFLQLPIYRNYFVQFCEELFCAENVYFWIDCEDFKFIPSDEYVRMTAQKIYRRYITDDSRFQVNVKSNIVKDIEKDMENPTRALYHAAQTEIEFLMTKDSFPKFKKSKYFTLAQEELLKATLMAKPSRRPSLKLVSEYVGRFST